MTDTYDLVAIGAESAGESATELASFFGLRWYVEYAGDHVVQYADIQLRYKYAALDGQRRLAAREVRHGSDTR